MLDIIVGLQWGDEGKGKIVDYLAKRNQYNYICRYQGGPNAGHTLVFEGKKFVLNTIPSGIFVENTKNVIGSAVVLDPSTLIYKEIESIKEEVPNLENRLIFSNKAHLICPSHKILDCFNETLRGIHKIGSTKRGIGPTYSDKYNRSGLRLGSIFEAGFERKYQQLLEKHKGIMKEYLEEAYSKKEEEQWFEAIEQMRKFQVINTEILINQVLENNKNVLAEGAQGTLLDIDYGTYPYVTSSNTIASFALTSLGTSPKHVNNIWGIFKAYCTRVGEGPFPTEQKDEAGLKLQKLGEEKGATTGRDRRCGWLDITLLKYAIALNGANKLAMMKADVLNTFEAVKTSESYKNHSEFNTAHLENVEPQYTFHPGWKSGISNHSMPEPFENYITSIEQQIGQNLDIVSYGPDRNQTLFL